MMRTGTVSFALWVKYPIVLMWIFLPNLSKAMQWLGVIYTRRFTNRKISELFGLSYSSVSRRVGIFREKLRVDKTPIVSGGGIHLEYLKALSVTPDIFTVS
jgi:hypothetical protein